MFCFSYKEKRVTSRHTLGMMRSEFLHRYRMSTDIFIDSLSTRTIFENVCLKINGSLNGFLQLITLSPFGFLLMCEIQVIISYKFFT